jgi:hypothetical protein
MICLLLSSCGGGSSSSNASDNLITNGNWSIAASSKTSGLKLDIGGSLVQSGTSVTGIVHITNSACFNYLSDDVQLSGSFVDNTLTLTSTAIRNQIVTITTTGTGNDMSGTYSITGGCADGDYGTLTAVYAPPITGTWTSTYTDTGATVTAVATLTQAPTADAHGRFPLTGTFVFAGSPCSTGGTIVSSTSSAVWGDRVTAAVTTNDVNGNQGALNYVATATSNSTNTANPAMMSGGFQVTAGVCEGDSPFLQFSKQ